MSDSTAKKVLAALANFNLKPDGQDCWRCNSPFMPGSNSHSFRLVIHGPEHGAFKDFNAAHEPNSGSLYDLAKNLGIAIPSSVPVENTKRAYAGMEDYAKAHGITGDVLRRWQWTETTYQGRPALQFMTRTGARWRFLDGAKGKPVYISEQGYRRCWFGLNKTVIEQVQAGSPLILCNGEISTIVGQHYGLPVIAMTSGEKGEIPDDLLSELKGAIAVPFQIIIALDCDKAGRAAAHGLERQLGAEGIKATAIDLGLSTGGDVADFCALYREESLARLQGPPVLKPTPEQSKWLFATIDDVLAMAPIDWLVPRQIPAKGLMMLYGPSGSYKSFFILDVALNLAVQGHNIVYIAAEGESGYRQRLEAWIKHHQIKPDNITFVLDQVDLFDPDDLYEFSRIVEGYKPRMIIVDTFLMCSGGADENNSRDMATIVQASKAMSKNINCVIVIVHHTNQEGRKERGSKILRNSCDTILRVAMEDDLIAVDCQKSKDSETFETFYLAPVIIDLGYKNNIGENVTSVVLLPAEKIIRGDKLTFNQAEILKAIAVQPAATITELTEITEIENRGSIQRALSRLIKLGLVSINGSLREITPEGRQMLDSLDSHDSHDSHDLQGQADRDQCESPATPATAESGESVQPYLMPGVGRVPAIDAIKG